MNFKNSLISFLFLCVIFFLKAENDSLNINKDIENLHFEKKTRPVLFEYTSTGCPGCGSWGKPTFYNLIKAHEGQITPLAIHIKYNDAMITPYSTDLGNNRHGMYFTPQIWVNDSNAVVILEGRIHPSSSHKATQMIKTAIQQNQPAVAANAQHKNNKIIVNFGVNFFDLPTDGEYSLACYLNENDIENFQVGYANNPAKHHHVIRDAAIGTYGFPFTKKQLENKIFTVAHEFETTSLSQLKNAYVTVVLWKKINDRYLVLNSNTTQIH